MDLDPSRTRARRSRAMVGGTLAGLALAALLVAVAVRYAAKNPEKANLGSSVLPIDADRVAKEVAERGPVLFKDPLNRDREIYVQHLGPDPDKGWVAVRAYASRISVDCLLRWDRSQRRFVDPCTKRSYPPDGEGLTTYPAPVTGGVVRIDLRTPRPG
ncbi:MAG TPA: hypothetical protein VM142_06280 [Acidimicrobiales bacterium]|nr:hypothetical protein [Acidimicrobiales bacterium]